MKIRTTTHRALLLSGVVLAGAMVPASVADAAATPVPFRATLLPIESLGSGVISHLPVCSMAPDRELPKNWACLASSQQLVTDSSAAPELKSMVAAGSGTNTIENPVRYRVSSTHYQFRAYVYYGIKKTNGTAYTLGKVYLKFDTRLRGRSVESSNFSISRVTGWGSDIRAKLYAHVQVLSGYGVYETGDERRCGPSGWLAGATYRCPYGFFQETDGTYYDVHDFGWTNRSEAHPKTSDGYWHFIEPARRITCKGGRAVRCQFDRH